MAKQKSTDLLSRVSRFLKRHGMRPTKFGRLAMKDPGFVRSLEEGRSPTIRTVERIEHFMKGYAE